MPTKKLRLTIRTIDRLVNTGKDYVVWDSDLPGFGMRVRSSGRKSFMVQHRAGQGRGAKQQKVTLGPYPGLAPEEARRLALDTLQKLHRGESPIEQRRAAQKAAITLYELCEHWHATDALRSRMRGEKFGTLRNPRNVENDWGRVIRHINPLIGKVKVTELTPRHVRDMRDAIARGDTAANIKTGTQGLARVSGGEGTAAKTVRVLSTILSFGVREGVLVSNPASNIHKAPSRKIERYLSKDEIRNLRSVINNARTRCMTSLAYDVIELLLLTGCRKSEIEGLKWAEIDFEHGFFRFGDSKTGQKTIPMSSQTAASLRRIPRVTGSPYVFPAQNGARGHYKGTPLRWQSIKKAAGLQDVRLHDLRHTFASVAATNGLSLPMIGALLGHSQPSTTARYAHLADVPLRDAADMVAGLISE